VTATQTHSLQAPREHLLHDRLWLQQRYATDRMTLREIAPLIGCSHQRVASALIRFGIERRPPARRFASPALTDGQWLYDRYVVQRRTTVELAAEIGVTSGAVCAALRRNGIRPRPPRHHPDQVDVLPP
jgi:hypothetical protein